MAIGRRSKPGSLMHHSDQVSQVHNEPFAHPMADHGITFSMSRSVNVWNNAAMERFYNPWQRHSTPGCLSPKELEEQTMPA